MPNARISNLFCLRDKNGCKYFIRQEHNKMFTILMVEKQKVTFQELQRSRKIGIHIWFFMTVFPLILIWLIAD